MANAVIEEIEPTSTAPPKWRTLIRQNSEKIGTFAEDVVLPKHRRSMHRPTNPYGVLALRDVESDGTYKETTTVKKPQPIEMRPKYFPLFMIGISALQLGLWYFTNKINSNFLTLLLEYDPRRRYEVWRFLSIMCVHTRLPHLLTNVMVQLVLGVLLEIVHSWSRIAVIYFASVVGGSLFITLLSRNSYAVGASAGVYGLLFSHLSTIILNWKEMDKKVGRLFMLTLYVIVDIALNLMSAPDDADTNYAGHLGGGVTGLLVSILVLKNFEKRQWKKNLQIVCIAILTTLAFVSVFVNLFAWNFYPPTEWNADYRESYDDFVYQRAIASPALSAEREYCRKFIKCKLLLNKFNVSSLSTTAQSN